MSESAYSEWYVEYQGKRLARLSDGQTDELWVDYKIDPVPENPTGLELLKEIWFDPGIQFRKIETGEVVPIAYQKPDGEIAPGAIGYPPRVGRVLMRGLYVRTGVRPK